MAILRTKQADGTWVEIPAIVGPKGDRGADGYTPIKGIDYFDGKDGEKGDPGEVDYSRITEHNSATDAHNDIRLLVEGLTTRLNALANSTDEDLDQLAEIVAYIKSNKSLIDGITTNKVNVADIIDNLTTNVSNKPLSAAQGVALKALIDAITVPTKISELTNDKGYLTSYTETDPTVPAWAKAATKPIYTASEVGADASGSANTALTNAKAYTDAEITEWVGDKTVSEQIDTALAQHTNPVYGTTSTTDYDKAVACDGFTLKEGAEIIVKFTEHPTDTNHLYLNVNSTGSKIVHYFGTGIPQNYFKKDSAYSFVYDGTNYQMSSIPQVAATTSRDGFMSAADKTKLDGVQSKLDAKAPLSHEHVVADITDLTATAAELNYVKGVTSSIQTQLNKKAGDYSIELYNGTSGNPKPVRFLTVNYTSCGSENGVAIKIGMVSGHGNGSSYAFLQDAIIKVSHTGVVSVDNFKYYGAETALDGARQFGDIFWVIDTTNKIVDFYCLMGQYARLQMTPYKRVTYSTGGTITQYTSASVYSSGEKNWANNDSFAMKSAIPTDYVTDAELNAVSNLVGDTAVSSQITDAINAMATETWTFTLEDGSTVTKAVYVG